MHLVLTLPTIGGARPDPLAPLDPLAAAVLARLAAEGHALGAVTRRPPRCGVPDTDLGSGRVARVRWWAVDPGDERARQLLADAFAGADAVLHLAGEGLAQVTDAAQVAGVPRLVAPDPADLAGDTATVAARLADALVATPAPVGVPAQRGSAAVDRPAPAAATAPAHM
ncbi:hypothetical protein [Nocardioides perillae]|uniref:Uncharacterized protein n=1 Tax=Nocardioides perillae TaxID=1119534 RepID=A0A7Y9ULQ1_9ACTN|nr:hypothetical protein [Nocardioides perillae]NYG56713.1 hypothetical protein [Nocardioides perillae]